MDSGSGYKYNPRDFPAVAVTVDVALFAIIRDALHILLIRRGVPPFEGAWALPGGFVQPNEDLDAAAARELVEETGVARDSIYLEQLRSYGAVDRDPRMRVVTVAYWAACATLPAPSGGSDAAHAELVPVSGVEEGSVELAFDHGRILRDAVDRLRAKLEYTALAARFCRPEFTISELRKVYDTIWDTELDPGNFQRKVRQNRPFRKVVAPAAPPDLHVRHDEMSADLAGSAMAASGRSTGTYMSVEHAEDPPGRRFHRGRFKARPGNRGGRPPSIWSIIDSDLTLNSPFVRKQSPGKD